MTDLERAKELLSGGGCTCVLIRGQTSYISEERGIAPLASFADSFGKGGLSGFAAADKIVGRAAALIYAYLGISELYAEVLSSGAEETLKQNGICFECGIRTENIVNRRGDGICPMESAVADIKDPVTALERLREKLRQIKSL